MPRCPPAIPTSSGPGTRCWRTATRRTSGGGSPNTPTTTSSSATAPRPKGALKPRAELDRRRWRQPDRLLDDAAAGPALAAIDEVGHRLRPKDQDQHENELQHDPRNRT